MSQGLELTKEQLARFIEHLSASANVTASAHVAGGCRRSFYNWRARDEDFAAEWDEALQRGLDALEDEGIRRAMGGTPRYVVSMGKIVLDPDGKPLVEHVASDTLLMFFLKARRPEIYRDRATVDLNVGDLAALIEDGRKRAREGIAPSNGAAE